MQAVPPAALHQGQPAAVLRDSERSTAVSGAARTQSPSLAPPSNAMSPSAAKSRAEHFIGIAKKYEQESRGCRVTERGGSGGPMSFGDNGSPNNKPLRGLQSRIAASNKKATQKEILSLKALERALELKVSLLHQALSNSTSSGGNVLDESGRSTPTNQIIEEIATNCSSLPARRSRVNYLENMIKPHLEVARLVESIVMKYNGVAVHWLKGADSGSAGDVSASSSSLKSNSKNGDSDSVVAGGESAPGVDDALGMLLEAAKFLQPPILQLLEYEKAAAKHVLTTVSSLENAKEEIVNQFAARRLRSRMVYGDGADGHEEDDLMFMEADVKRPMRVPGNLTSDSHHKKENSTKDNDQIEEVDEMGLTNEDRQDIAALANAMPIPDTAKQNSLLHGAGVRFRKLYKIVADNEEALLRDMIYRESCYSGGETQASTTGSTLQDSVHRPPTAISLVVSPSEVATVLGQDAVKTAWYDNPVQAALMGSYLCNKTPQADLHKAIRRLQSMDLAQLYLLGLRQDDPTLISTALDGGFGGGGHHKVETNTTSSAHVRGGGSASQADTYQGQLFRALGVFMSPGEKGPFVNPVAISNLYFTFPMLHNANGPGHVADDPELADLTLAVSRIVGSVVLRLRATTLNNIACVLRRKGELQQAISFVHSAIQLEERGHLLISALGSSAHGKSSIGSRPPTAQARDQKNLTHSLNQVDVSPHDPTSFLSSVLNQLKGGSDTDKESVWGQSTALASITNLSAMYGQIGRYQEAAAHAKKAVILYQQQNALLLRNPPGSEASTVFPLSPSGTHGNPMGIGASQLEGRPPSSSVSDSLLQQQQQKKPKSSGIVGLGAVIYHNLAMALEPSDPNGCVQAYNTALRLAINDLGGEWSPASTTIKNNRNQYLQWLDRRRGVAKLIQGATLPAPAPKLPRSRSASPIGLGSGVLSPRPPSGRNGGTTSSSLRPSSSRTYTSQKAPMSAGRRVSRGSSAPPIAPSGPSVLVRNIDGTHAFDFSEVKQTDLLLLNAEEDADNAELVSEVVAPFLGSESPLSLPDLQRLRLLNAKIQSQLRETGVVDLDTFTATDKGTTLGNPAGASGIGGGTTSPERPAGGSRSPVFNLNVSLSGEETTTTNQQNTAANRLDSRPPRPSSSLIHASAALCESSDIEVTLKGDSRKPPRAPQPPSTSSLNASPPPSTRRVSVSITNHTMEQDSQSLREPAFSLLIETQTSLIRTGDLLNSELANNLMISTLANLNSSNSGASGTRNAPQPPTQKQSSPSRQLKPRFSRGSPRGGARTDPSRRGRQHYGGADHGDHDHDDQVLSGYIKEPKAPQSLPKEFFNEVKKGDELVQFFATRLNNLLRIEEVVESRYKRALTVQCAWRAYIARGRSERLRKHRESKTFRLVCKELKATRTIVSFFRTLTDRRRQINKEKQDSALEKLRRLTATIVFQKNLRRWLAVQEVGRLRRQRGRFLASVFKVQQQAKKWLAVQCRRRAHIAQEFSRKQHKIDCERTAAATKIQACFRSHWARIAVCYIKGDYKGAMMRNRRVYRDWAARLLQRNVRGYLVRKTTHQELNDRRTVRHNKARTAMRLNAVLKISSVWRGFFVRKFKQKDLHQRIQHAREVRLCELQIQSVLVLQRAVRCMMAKNELKRRKAQRKLRFEASRGMSFEVVPIPLY